MTRFGAARRRIATLQALACAICHKNVRDARRGQCGYLDAIPNVVEKQQHSSFVHNAATGCGRRPLLMLALGSIVAPGTEKGWEPVVLGSLDSVLELCSIDLRVPLARLYEDEAMQDRSTPPGSA